jgi:aspartyl-tRNA(Asn)/glutamyl-tRNA(Gln) amidotransferase subunit A
MTGELSMEDLFVHRPGEASAAGSGPLHGMKVALQPNCSVAGWPADAGSNALADFKALEDATIAERLREAGADLCGTTRMSEFGFGLNGSRAGEAVRQGVADAELVPDLMGESRLAALRASVFGFKPGYGRLSRLGVIGLIPSMECSGLLAVDLEVIAKLLDAVAGPDEMDFSMAAEPAVDPEPAPIDPSRLTLGVIPEARQGLSDHQQAGFRQALATLSETGAAIRDLSFPEFSLFPLVHQIVGAVEASSCAGRYDSVRYGRRAPGAKNWNEMYLRSRGAAFGPLVKSYLFQGAYFQFEQYAAFEAACRIRARLVARMDRLAAEVDALALPAVGGSGSGSAASLADTYAQFGATLFANVTGQPALVLPPCPETGGAGLQLTAARGGDGRLLALGRHLFHGRGGKA